MGTALITGANRGLGLELAKQYATDGWRVIATCREPSRAAELHTLGPNLALHRLDVADFGAVKALGRELEGEAIDVLIANAGVLLEDGESLDAPDAEAWLRSFKVNTMAPLVCAGAFLDAVARSRERKMLAISSLAGSIGAATKGGHYAYRSSKAALNAVWRSFALDHPEVIAAVLHPGRIRTDMMKFDQAAWNTLPLPEERAADLRRLIARLTQADSGGFFNHTGQTLPW